MVAARGHFCWGYAWLVLIGHDQQKRWECGGQACYDYRDPRDCVDDFFKSPAGSICCLAQSASYEYGDGDRNAYNLSKWVVDFETEAGYVLVWQAKGN